MGTWTNMDGLEVNFGLDRAKVIPSGNTSATPKVFELAIDATELSNTASAPTADAAFLPPNAVIKSATVIVTEAFASSGAATLNIGAFQSDGTAIDADGIDASVALADLAANKAVVADGAMVGSADTQSVNTYIQATWGTAAFTAGKAKVLIEYVA